MNDRFAPTQPRIVGISDADAAARAMPASPAGIALPVAWVAVIGIPILAYANFILNDFYVLGSNFWDTGVVAGVIWRRDAWLTYAPLWPIGALYAYHVMPLLSVLTLISRWLPIGLPGWFALVTGVGHALPSIGIFWLFTAGLGFRSARGLAVSVILAVGFAFTGIPLATILFPHPEIILAGGLILLCAAVARERFGIAAGCLVLTLLVREDAGFHAFSILFLLALFNWKHRRPWREIQPLLILAAIGFGYSCSAFMFKQVVFPNQPALFAGEYLGNPPFGNISPRLVLLRLAGLPIYRGYFFWPAMAALAMSIRTRNVLFVLGYIACLPWLLLHVFADREILGTLSGYYSFPFLAACAWPLAAVIIDARQRGVAPDRRHALAGAVVMLALSFVSLPGLWNPQHIDLWRSFTRPASGARIRATEAAVGILLKADARFGTIAVDQSVYSFAPYSFSASTVVSSTSASGGPAEIDTVAWFEAGPDAETVRARIAQARLTSVYRFKDTAILVASDRGLDGIAGLEPVSAIQ